MTNSNHLDIHLLYQSNYSNPKFHICFRPINIVTYYTSQDVCYNCSVTKLHHYFVIISIIVK